MTDARPLVLIVDDDASIGRVLEDVLQPMYATRSFTSARAALEVVNAADVAVVLADQRMPGMTGLELLAEVRRLNPTAVGVLMTAHADLHDALQAINTVRALGFVTKPWQESELLAVIERAIDAHLTLRQLRRASEKAEHELRALEDMSAAAPTPITAQRFGVLPLRDSVPTEFAELCRRYAEILKLALEQRVFKVDHPTGRALFDLADILGSLNAGPRDVIDLHVSAVRESLSRTRSEEATALSEEGRLVVLELMGYLVTYYRSYRLGVRT
jgi:FixJ family two-component response regulator